MAALLRILGAETCVVYDGLSALESLSQFKPAAALVDINMPKMDGLEVARRIRLRAEGRNMRLVALTGRGQLADCNASRSAGFDQHLVKPTDIDQLQK